MKEYTLTFTIKNILEAKGQNLVCHKCRKPLEIGQEIVSKCSSRHGAKYYHKQCYIKLYEGEG